METFRDAAALVGRVLLCAIFVMAGFEKIGGFAGSVAYAQGAGLPWPQVAVAIALAIELVGGLMVLVGFRARLGALAIAVFSAVAAFSFHRYWSMPPAQQVNGIGCKPPHALQKPVGTFNALIAPGKVKLGRRRKQAEQPRRVGAVSCNELFGVNDVFNRL